MVKFYISTPGLRKHPNDVSLCSFHVILSIDLQVSALVQSPAELETWRAYGGNRVGWGNALLACFGGGTIIYLLIFDRWVRNASKFWEWKTHAKSPTTETIR